MDYHVRRKTKTTKTFSDLYEKNQAKIKVIVSGRAERRGGGVVYHHLEREDPCFFLEKMKDQGQTRG